MLTIVLTLAAITVVGWFIHRIVNTSGPLFAFWPSFQWEHGMARQTAEGKVKIIHCLTVEDLSAPTIAELEAGKKLTVWLPTAGLGFSHTQNKASLPMIDKGKIAQAMGTQSVDVDLTFVLDDEDNDPFEYFSNGLQGVLVRSVFGWTGDPDEDGDPAPDVGDICMTYQCEAGDPQPLPPGQDEYQQHTVPFGVEDWDVKAVVAANPV